MANLKKKQKKEDKVVGRAKSTEMLSNILDDPTKRINEAEDVLATMIRSILAETGLSFSQITGKTHDWLTRVYQGKGENRSVANKYLTDFSNFIKQIAQRAISAKVFMRFIAMLGAKRYKLTLTLYYDDHPDPSKARVEEYSITSTTINALARDDEKEDVE